MQCSYCHADTKRFGSFRNRKGVVQRFRCLKCGKTFSETQPFEGLRIDQAKIVQIVHLLCEGVGIRACDKAV